MMQHIVWLASWYPDAYEHDNGDFVQRHAEALSAIVPIDVIHFVQAGACVKIDVSETLMERKGNFTEYIISFAFHPIGIGIIDKIRYNLMYQYKYRKFIKKYIKEKGKPAFVHVHVPMKAGLIALWMKRKYKMPYIVTEHASHYDENAEDDFFRRSIFYRFNTRQVFKNAIAVTNVSKTIGEKLKNIFHLKKVTVIPNVVDENIFYYKKNEEKIFRWIHVSSLRAQKNPEGLIKAFALLKQRRKDWELIIVGPATQELQVFAQKTCVSDYTQFKGEISHEQVAKEMQQANAFVLFSKHENLPCVILEALCCGLPVVTTNVGGIAEVINATNGYLVNNEDIESLSDKLEAMMDGYKSFNRSIISNKAILFFGKDAVSKQFIQLYKQYGLLREK